MECVNIAMIDCFVLTVIELCRVKYVLKLFNITCVVINRIVETKALIYCISTVNTLYN